MTGNSPFWPVCCWLAQARRHLPVRALAAGLEHASLSALIAGGLVVGLGTGIGNGCTSGHGICGLARFSKRSLIAVVVFMPAAAAMVFIRRTGGWL
ncbi:YeeE/YedE thiosulfate transporter family protein [Novosphingobium sp.]|uniref:YeeE/YedE family protein n=1 Tax=Novosphingobium sp. TaxID=1874826 RepID=UPI0025D5F190|nr:YeeE/YedE thiosulfate transporter family protein [Novosphingobium sp.]